MEDFVEFLTSRSAASAAPEPEPLDSEMDAIRNRLLKAHGPFQTLPLIHEYRDQIS